MLSPLTLRRIAEVCEGQLLGADGEVQQLTTDSRKVAAGDLFVALRGERFDGHEFAAAAAAAGAAALMVDSAVAGVGVPQVVVADTTRALGLIAREVRRQFRAPLLALTGSCGKTSVKELIAGILAGRGQVAATRGNLNNHIGVPLTLLDLTADDKFAVVEMGASGPGEIAWLCALAEPQVVLVNNVMPAHLEGFGSLQGVADAKGEIYQGVAAGGTAVVNLDEPFAGQWLRAMSVGVRVLTFSASDPTAAFYAAKIQLNASGAAHFDLHTPDGVVPVQLQLLGLQQVSNALAAAACAWAVAADTGLIQAGLQSAGAVNGRMQALAGRNGALIINDTYNANPGSVRAAIDALAAMGERTNKWLVLGALAELGSDAETMMQELGVYARNAGLKQLLCVGDLTRVTAAAFGAGAVTVANHEAAVRVLDNKLDDNTLVLIKGSRSARMEVVVQALTRAGGSL